MTLTMERPRMRSRTRTYEPHPLSLRIPVMTEAQFDALTASVRLLGKIIKPGMLYQEKILDGRHRYLVSVNTGIPMEWIEFDGTEEEAESFVAGEACRRNLNKCQLATTAVEFIEHFEKLANSRRKNGDREKIPSCPSGKSVDLAGRMFGVNGRYVADAKWLREHNRKLFEQVSLGALKLSEAKRAVQNELKHRKLKAKAHHLLAPASWQFHASDCIEWMEQQPGGCFNLIFADPPYNIGVDYGFGKQRDLLPNDVFHDWCRRWMAECYRLLRPNGSCWVLINDEHAAEFKLMLQEVGFTVRRWIKWYETFGVNCANNFNRTSRHLFYCTYHPTNFVFNESAVTRKSDRQTKYNDPRANPAGKIWDDVWQIPRLVDNAAERMHGVKNQLPLDLLRPIVGCSSDPGDVVFDPFLGTGTTAEAACEVGRKFVGTDINPKRVELAEMRMRARCK